jgi:hypothetical protein
MDGTDARVYGSEVLTSLLVCVLLCYLMLCYVTLCYVMLCCVVRTTTSKAHVLQIYENSNL